MLKLYLFFFILSICFSKILFSENFDSANYSLNWKSSKYNENKQANFNWTTGKLAPEGFSHGLQTEYDMKSYILSHRLPEKIYLNQSTVVFQYSVKFEQPIICGSACIKLLNYSYDETQFGPMTPALITFGPEVCASNNRVLILLDSAGRPEKWLKTYEAPLERSTHFYTLEVNPKGSYGLYIDGNVISKGKIEDEWFKLENPVKNFVIGGVGLDIWQSKAGTLIDNILITDNLEEALDIAKKFRAKFRDEELRISGNFDKEEMRRDEEYRKIHEAAQEKNAKIEHDDKMLIDL